jgi:hypothetical protein
MPDALTIVFKYSVSKPNLRNNLTVAFKISNNDSPAQFVHLLVGPINSKHFHLKTVS